MFLERLAFEMDKRYEETKLQVLLSPALLIAKDQYQVLCTDVSCCVQFLLLTVFSMHCMTLLLHFCLFVSVCLTCGP